MIDFAKLTPDQIVAACERAMAECDAAIDRIVATPEAARTFENTFVALESAMDIVVQTSGTYGFMAYVSDNDQLRETARDWEEKLSKYAVELGFREDLYNAVKQFAASAEAKSLTGDEARLIERTLRDYRRNGFELPKEKRALVQELNQRLVELGTEFRRAIDTWDDGVLATREQLAGMPDRWIDALKTVEEGGVTKYRVSLDYPEIMPFMENGESAELRKELFIKNQNKGGEPNVGVLEEAIRVRNQIATLLGYDSWAAYVVEKRMAKTRSNVDDFLRDLQAKVNIKAGADMEALSRQKQAHVGSGEIEIWDWWYYTNLLQKTEYAVDDFEVANYFPLDAVLDGLFDVMQQLLGVRFQPAPDAPRWHEDVQAFDIFDAGGGRAVRPVLHGPLPAPEQVQPRRCVHSAGRPPPARRLLPAARERHRRQLHEANSRRAVIVAAQRGGDLLPRVRPHPAPDPNPGRVPGVQRLLHRA
jgi:Zn-dependent oligopeptidase